MTHLTAESMIIDTGSSSRRKSPGGGTPVLVIDYIRTSVNLSNSRTRTAPPLSPLLLRLSVPRLAAVRCGPRRAPRRRTSPGPPPPRRPRTCTRSHPQGSPSLQRRHFSPSRALNRALPPPPATCRPRVEAPRRRGWAQSSATPNTWHTHILRQIHLLGRTTFRRRTLRRTSTQFRCIPSIRASLRRSESVV